jgi:pyruvate dehydrogenase E2 component (dihydrolipoamide acetyltransferase)
MLKEIVLPNLGFGMEEGRVARWLCNVGQRVVKGDVVAEIEGDKATVELESLADGILAEILVPAGQSAPVGAILARIGQWQGEADHEEVDLAGNTAASGENDRDITPPLLEHDSPRLSPVARRMAAKHGVETTGLTGIQGSGPGGRIMRADVESATQSGIPTAKPLAAPAIRRLASDHQVNLYSIEPTGSRGQITRADVERHLDVQSQPSSLEMPVQSDWVEVPLSTMRTTIGRRLMQSVQQSPHFFTTALLDLTDAIAALPDGTGLNALILYLTTGALQDVPQLNATCEDGRLFQHRHVHLALAVALDDGLLTPVIHNADHLSLAGLSEQAKLLVRRTRENKIRPEDLSGGSFTVSNLGIIQQIEYFTAIINPPQIAILAVGAVKERPHVICGGLHIRTSAYVTLCADHRFIDGMLAARFLQALEVRTTLFARQEGASP